MLWGYKLYQFHFKAERMETMRANIYSAEMEQDSIGDHLRVKSRIQSPRPRPKGYWNPYSPYG